MDDNEMRDVDNQIDPEPPSVAIDDREGIPWGAVFLLIWAVALIIFSVQNAEDTTVEFLAWTWTMPVALLVMVTALITLVLTAIGSALYRRKRRQRRQMSRTLRSDD